MSDQIHSPANFEAALTEIDSLVSKMESGSLPLEQLLVSYQRGAMLLKYCKEQLQAVERQVNLLENGEISPWNAA